MTDIRDSSTLMAYTVVTYSCDSSTIMVKAVTRVLADAKVYQMPWENKAVTRELADELM